MSKKRKKPLRVEASAPVFVRTITICWRDRTIEIDGRKLYAGEQDCLAMPVLSDTAVFVPCGLERIA